MELYPPMDLYPSPWLFRLSSHLLLSSFSLPTNYVHWTQTPESHLFSADLPGVRKEDIRVEVEDARYLIIRTEYDDGSDDEDDADADERRRRRGFMRKFRLPQMVDVDGISAGYADGVLTVTVPRAFVGGQFSWLRIDPADIPDGTDEFGASAA